METVVKVKFIGSKKEYAYQPLQGDTYEVGDKVVVFALNQYSVATVTKVVSDQFEISQIKEKFPKLEYLVNKVELSKYEAQKEKEKQAKIAKRILDKELEKAKENEKYRALIMLKPELQKYLDLVVG